jgi:hypothetical protein
MGYFPRVSSPLAIGIAVFDYRRVFLGNHVWFVNMFNAKNWETGREKNSW